MGNCLNKQPYVSVLKGFPRGPVGWVQGGHGGHGVQGNLFGWFDGVLYVLGVLMYPFGGFEGPYIKSEGSSFGGFEGVLYLCVGGPDVPVWWVRGAVY